MTGTARDTPRESALLVVDMQNAFCHPEGSVPRSGTPLEGVERAVEVTARAVASAHDAGVPVVFTRHAYRPGYIDIGRNVVPFLPLFTELGALVAGTWDAEVLDGLGRRETDHTVDKARFDAFLWTSLGALLGALGVQHLWVCGVITSVCVESTVRTASMRDLEVSLVADGCADVSADRHARTVEVLTAWGFVTTVDVDDIARRRSRT